MAKKNSWLQNMSLFEKQSYIEPGHPRLSIARQCKLLGFNRSGYSRQNDYSMKKSSENLKLMRLIDEEYTRHSFYGSCKIRDYLRRCGYKVNRKRIQRLMRMGIQSIAPRPDTSAPRKKHKIYPYMKVKSKKSFLFVAALFPPCSSIGGFRVLGFVKNLFNMGYGIKVLSLKKYHNEPIDFELLKKIPEGVDVIRTNHINLFDFWKKIRKRNIDSTNIDISNKKKSNGQRNILFSIKEHISYFLITPDSYIGWLPFSILSVFMLKKKPDYIIATAPPYTALIIGMFLKYIWKKLLIIDLRDPWIDNAYGHNRPAILEKWNKYLENKVFKNADLIISNNTHAAKLYAEEYPEYTSKICTITNGFDETFENITPVRITSNLELSIIHTGTLYGKRNIKNLINALEKVDARLLKINLFGIIDDKTQEMMIEKSDCVFFNGRVVHEKAVSYLKGADIILIIGNCVPDSVQIPGKIFEVLPFGKSIWLIDKRPSPTYDILKEVNIDFYYSENNENSIKSTLQEILYGWENNRDIKNTNALGKIDRFSRKELTKKLLEKIKSLKK